MLLKRRKTTLESYVNEIGIHTYASLLTHCNSLGVASPTEKQFKKAMPDIVSVPEEGVIVLAPCLEKDDTSSEQHESDIWENEVFEDDSTQPNIPSLKKRSNAKRKKQEHKKEGEDG